MRREDPGQISMSSLHITLSVWMKEVINVINSSLTSGKILGRGLPDLANQNAGHRGMFDFQINHKYFFLVYVP